MSGNIVAGKSAVVFGSLLVGGFLVISCFAVLDDQNRHELEVLRETSAVGDPVVFVIPEGLTPEALANTEVVTIQGKGYYPVDQVKRSDGTMAKAGFADDGKTPIYRRVRNGKLQKEFYLKLAPGRFMELGETPEKPRIKRKKTTLTLPSEGEPAAQPE